MSYYEHAEELQYYAEEPPIQRAFGTAYNIGLDLATTIDTSITEGQQYIELDFGVVLEAPPGYWLMVVPRSSTFKKWGLIMANSVGIIDPSYCGPKDTIRALFLTTKEVYIPKGTRLVQVLCIPMKLATVVHHSTVPARASRGDIGSTGD